MSGGCPRESASSPAAHSATSPTTLYAVSATYRPAMRHGNRSPLGLGAHQAPRMFHQCNHLVCFWLPPSLRIAAGSLHHLLRPFARSIAHIIGIFPAIFTSRPGFWHVSNSKHPANAGPRKPYQSGRGRCKSRLCWPWHGRRSMPGPARRSSDPEARPAMQRTRQETDWLTGCHTNSTPRGSSEQRRCVSHTDGQTPKSEVRA